MPGKGDKRRKPETLAVEGFKRKWVLETTTEQNKAMKTLREVLIWGKMALSRLNDTAKRPRAELLKRMQTALRYKGDIKERCEFLVACADQSDGKDSKFDINKHLIHDLPPQAENQFELAADFLLFRQTEETSVKSARSLLEAINIDNQLEKDGGMCLSKRIQEVLTEMQLSNSAASSSQHPHISAASCTPASPAVPVQVCVPSCAAGSAEDQAGVGRSKTAAQLWADLQSLPPDEQTTFRAMLQGSSMASDSETLPDESHSAQNSQDSKLAPIEQLLHQLAHLRVIHEAHVRRVLNMIQENCGNKTPQQIIKLICKAVGKAASPGDKARLGGPKSVLEEFENILSEQNNGDDGNVTWQDIFAFLAEVGWQHEDDDVAGSLEEWSRSRKDFSDHNQGLWNSLREFFETLKNISDEKDEDESDHSASSPET